MMSMACGLAATGKRPYASTFAIFATGRAYDQIRLGIAHNELPVKICASHGGVSLGEDGASHQMIEDIALMRVMPNMTVVVPADYNQAYRATLDSYESDEPQYLRFGRPATPVVYEDVPETLGTGVDVLREGKDISLFATGHMVWRALEAAESLEPEDGIEAEVVNVSIIKPIHSESVLESLAKTGVAVTAEEHRIVGGLADAVRHVAAEQHPVPIFAVGMGDEFGISGTGEACMEHFGLTARGIADRAREALLHKPIVSHPPLLRARLDLGLPGDGPLLAVVDPVTIPVDHRTRCSWRSSTPSRSRSRSTSDRRGRSSPTRGANTLRTSRTAAMPQPSSVSQFAAASPRTSPSINPISAQAPSASPTTRLNPLASACCAAPKSRRAPAVIVIHAVQPFHSKPMNSSLVTPRRESRPLRS